MNLTGWQLAVYEAIRDLSGPGTPTVSRHDLIHVRLFSLMKRAGSGTREPGQAVSLALQRLRDKGLIEFVGVGMYRLREPGAEAVPMADLFKASGSGVTQVAVEPRPQLYASGGGGSMSGGLRIVVDDSSIVQQVEREGPAPVAAVALTAERTEELRAALQAKRIEQLAVGVLYQNVDREHYQRMLDEAKVSRIQRDFDPDALGVPLVCERADGTFWILDGQHRIEAVRRRFGVAEKVWCDIVREREPKAEAGLFRRVNTERSGLTALQSWHTDRMVGVRDVLDAERVLQQYGRKVGTGEREVRCAGAIREIVRPPKTGVDDLHWVMDVGLRAWGTNPQAVQWLFRAVVMRGLHTFHARYRTDPDFNKEHLIRQLARVTPQIVAARGDNIRGRALESGEVRGLRANPTQCFARALWRVYNERGDGGLLPLRGDRTRNQPRRLEPWDGPSEREAADGAE